MTSRSLGGASAAHRSAHSFALMVKIAALAWAAVFLFRGRIERSDFTPNQTGVAACQFTAGAHPQVVAHERALIRGVGSNADGPNPDDEGLFRASGCYR